MAEVARSCKGPNSKKREFIEVELDRAEMSYLNLIRLKGKLGYSSRAYMFYKKRVRNDVASLVLIDYESDANAMIKDNERERKVRLLLTRDEPSNKQVSITPLKRPRETTSSKHPRREDPIDAYKVWLADLQDKANEQDAEDEQEDVDEQDKQPHPKYRDDYRIETIKTYMEWLRLRRELSDILQYVEEEIDGVRTPPRDENDESNPSHIKWPSHAGHPKKKGKDTKEGPIEPNVRAFVDEVVSCSRKRTPLIGVTSWKDIKEKVKNSIVTDVLNKWTFPNNVNAKEKILDIASERYKGWRSTFSSTYKAYNTYDDRMRNKPDNVDIVEWHYLILYFGTEKFQKVSQTISENRKQQKVMHLMGSKPYSQYSQERRDPETGEEPSDMARFRMTHCRNGTWSNSVSMHDNVSAKMVRKEMEEDRLMPTEEENIVFQESYKETTRCKTSKPHGYGYLAKYPTQRQLLNAQTEEAARVSIATQERNIELEGRERILEEKTRHIQEEEKKAREALRAQLMADMASLLEKQREEASQKANPESNMPVDNVQVRKTGTSKVHQKNNAYISPHQLRSAANKNRVWPRAHYSRAY
ncbi:hypothetical protein EJB05_56892, partial [Eragrostis curvula]